MADSASAAVIKGIYSALTVNPTLITLLGGAKIYDTVPQKAAFPFVSMGQTIERDWSTGQAEASEHLITLHVWSRYRGRRQNQDILNEVKASLHTVSLSLTDHHLINLRHLFSEVRRDPDGETFHGITRYRAVTEPI